MPTAWGTRRKRRSKRKKRTSAINDAAAAVRGSTAVRHGEDDEDQGEAKKRNPGTTEQLQDGDGEDVVSSAPSSLLCEPYIPDDEEYNLELYEAFELEPLKIKFEEKIGRQMQMPTLQNFMPISCLAMDPQLAPIRERGTNAVLSAAKFLLGLSSSIGGKPLLRCSGFWIDWDDESKTGTIFTTAHLIRSNNSEFDVWLGQDEYDPNAKVMVHLLDDTIVEAHLLYYQVHYDIALFSARVDSPVQFPSFNDRVQYAQEVFVLGRDEIFDLRITHGRVEYLNPDVFQRYHFMFSSKTDANQYDDGGLVIDLDGKVVGMVNISSLGSFIPCSILLKCLDLWRKYGHITRPHLGFKFLAIKFLDPLYIEKIWRKYNIDDGLIVNEVADGSNGEMLGIRRGDIISCFNGEQISTTVELENLLLDICKDFDRTNQPSVEVDVVIKVFNTRKSRWRELHLTTNISEHGEVVARDSLGIKSS
ncbi:hypothetical protein ACQ4PT_021430 [Festuca glaucescens]